MTPYTTERKNYEAPKPHYVSLAIISCICIIVLAIAAIWKRNEVKEPLRVSYRAARMDFADRIGYNVGHSEILRK